MIQKYAYWVFDIHVQKDAEFGFVSESDAEGLNDTASFTPDIETVYKRVAVEPQEGVAWYEQSEVGPDTDLYHLRERDGKVYVPLSQVSPSPPNGDKRYRDVVEKHSPDTGTEGRMR